MPVVAGGGQRDTGTAAAPRVRLRGVGGAADGPTDGWIPTEKHNPPKLWKMSNCGAPPEKLSLGKQNCLKHVHH